MKRLIPLLFFMLVFVVFPLANTFAQCTGERWTVKIGTDSDVALVNLNSTTASTISDLTSLPVPNTLPENSRIQPPETTTWVINATLVKYVRSYDADYHMVFTDSSGRTMIGEIPDPGCMNSNSPFAAGV